MDGDEERIQVILEKLSILREMMPETPLDAEKKAMEIDVLEEELSEIYQRRGSVPQQPKQSQTIDDLSEQIASITDELMEIEIKMLKAEMRNDEDERVKLQMCTSSLKARRQELVDRVKELNRPSTQQPSNDLESRVEALEREVADMKAMIYSILTRN